MMIEGFHPKRRVIGALLFGVFAFLPFLEIGGESAFRFDVPSLRLLFFGAVVRMDEFFLVLAAVLFLTFLFITGTLLFGRIWCGWMCPQTVLMDITGAVEKPSRQTFGRRILGYGTAVLTGLLVSASIVWYFIPPAEFFGQLFSGEFQPAVGWSWGILSVVTVADLILIRRTFCAAICPYAKLQSVMFDNRTLLIAFDEARRGECMNCGACAVACPVGVDIRKGMNHTCIACAECIDTCRTMTARRNRKSLIGYSFGEPGESGKIIRPGVLAFCAVTSAMAVLLLFLVFSRTPVDAEVFSAPSVSPRSAQDGSAVNGFVIALRNRLQKPADVMISVKGKDRSFMVIPAHQSLGPNEDRKVSVFVVMKESAAGIIPENMNIEFIIMHGDTVIRKTAIFRSPERR